MGGHFTELRSICTLGRAPSEDMEVGPRIEMYGATSCCLGMRPVPPHS